MAVKVEGRRIEITRGDSLKLQINLTREGQPTELVEGDTLIFTARPKEQFDYKNYLSAFDAVITKEIPYDTRILHLVTSDTKNLKAGVYYYDVCVRFADGEVQTVIPLYDFDSELYSEFIIHEEVHI